MKSPDYLVKGEYTNHVNKTGWGILDIATNPAYPDKQQVQWPLATLLALLETGLSFQTYD